MLPFKLLANSMQNVIWLQKGCFKKVCYSVVLFLIGFIHFGRRIFKSSGSGKICDENSTAPPCTG